MAESPFIPELVEVLLFDLGGVVIDIDFGRCFASWAQSAGLEVTEVASRFSVDPAYEEHERGNLHIDHYLDNLRRSLQVDLPNAQLLEGWNAIYIGVDPDVINLLDGAQTQFPLFAFTNTNPTHQSVWTTRFAAELEVFTAVYSSSEIGHRKPDRAAFDAVASLIDAPPESILFFDDSPENVAGASDAGMQAVHVTSSESVRSALGSLSGIGTPH